MREIKDADLLNAYLQKHKLTALFDTANLPFHLYEYEPGEMMNIAHAPMDYLKFVVKGEWNIYCDNSNGKRHLICHGNDFTLLGDLEFCGEQDPSHWQEVLRTVHCVELPLQSLRATLLEDNRFLRLLLHSLSQKLALSARSRDGAANLEEALLYYLRYESRDGTVEGVEQTALRLHYSRRQLQRVLKSLTDKRLIKKTAKGRYALVEQRPEKPLSL